MYWNPHGMSGWGWFAMSLSTVVFWALLIAVGVLLFRSLDRGRPGAHGESPHSAPAQALDRTPEQVLAGRFARGEIDEEEYRRRLSVLRSDGPDRTSPSSSSV
ncbi:SHOCT domain-containing protein [Streptomyces minutiscleroticus]|uniref:SHOCT domain-containing protein n=1 Tax=Streptomyces minutiscleroticus TaxID=68238 RepID=A0A918KEC3_9ACTN|nr:SHOCT domain-containing protein [Streptomyces minutiscleroticus]GGX60246.1 hypothetical protein GCM10010358_13490 [Streptomyces minutiscleroticus]